VGLVDGKVAVVTGGGAGIGRELSRGLAAEGAAVMVADLDERGADETVRMIADAGGLASWVHTDVASEESTLAMARATVAEFEGLDILVNNAGIWRDLPMEAIDEMSVAFWQKVLAVNLTGPFLCARAVKPHLIARGGGCILNISSIAAYITPPLGASYSTSKGGVITLTKALARELGEENIRVNAIAPGVTMTESTMSVVPVEMLDMLEINQCLSGKGEADDLVGPALFLVSDMSRRVTGQVLVVDGGMVTLG
jgi:NAD(P)-dependent dehydrogenase (short-subunit alcohol dehydrogenase family)